MPKLTKRIIDDHEPQDKDYIVWDTEIRGLGIRIWPSGKKVFFLKYRNKHGRQRKPVIGVYGTVAPEKARMKAIKWLDAVNDGGDPSGDREEWREVPIFEEFSKRYITAYAKPNKKPRSVEEDERLLKNCIKPYFGKMKITAITKVDVSRFHASMSTTPVNANRALNLLSKAFNLAETWGLKPDGTNPCKHVKKYPEKAKERFLSNDELAMLAGELRTAELQKTEMQSVIDAIRLLLFTGCRLSEILTLKWDYVDMENACIRLPDSKTGAKSVYLAPAAMEVLSGIKRKERNPYVLIGRKPGGRLVNLQKPWRRILMRVEVLQMIEHVAEVENWTAARIEKAKQDALEDLTKARSQYREQMKKLKLENVTLALANVRLHDLRHTFASVGAASKQSLQMIGRLLGHSQTSTTERYSHLYGDPLREAANVIVGRIAEAMMPDIEKQQAEIIELPKQKA